MFVGNIKFIAFRQIINDWVSFFMGEVLNERTWGDWEESGEVA